MNSTRLLILLAFLLPADLLASGPPVIKISTTESKVTYRLEDNDVRKETDTKYLSEVDAWIRIMVKRSQSDPFMIYPDEKTTFKTVAELVLLLKATGVENFALVRVEVNANEQTTHLIRGQTNKIVTSRGSATPRSEKRP